MPEAEAMCLRVGILVNGQFTAIGSCEHLKAKHGRNFILNIKIVPGYQLANLEKIKNIIDETFPTIKFKDSYLVSKTTLLLGILITKKHRYNVIFYTHDKIK